MLVIKPSIVKIKSYNNVSGYRLWIFFSPYDFLTLAFLFLYVHLFYNAAISMNIYVHVLRVTVFSKKKM